MAYGTVDPSPGKPTGTKNQGGQGQGTGEYEEGQGGGFLGSLLGLLGGSGGSSSGSSVIPALIGAGATIYGQQAAKNNASKLGKQQQPLIDMLMQNAKFLQPYGQQNLQQGQQGFQQYLDYLTSLTGSRQRAMQMLAPQINQMAQSQQGAVQAQRSLYPRGGMTASAGSQLPFQLQGNVNNMLFGAQTDAWNQLGNARLQQQQLGMAGLGQQSGMTNNLLNYGLNAQNQMFGQGAAIGQGIASLVGPYMQYAMMNQRQSLPASSNAYSYTGPGFTGGTSPYGNPFSGIGGNTVQSSVPNYYSSYLSTPTKP